MKPTILVIDDDASLVKLYCTAFSVRGYRVLSAQNGEEGMATAEREKPDLILLDVMMPEIHGLHVLDILKSTPSMNDTKIIMLTALSDQATKERALECGAFDYIVKSETSMAEIIDKVHRILS